MEIAVPVGEHGAQFSQEVFRDLELLVSKGSTYRGRIISLEAYIDPMGGGSLVKVHRLHKVDRRRSRHALGRIDQAIEFPLPDDDGRVKLAKLYSRGLEITPDLLNIIVCSTEGVSAAFIKELMRRCA